MKDYEKEIAWLTPDQKLELWQKYKDSSLSNKTRFTAIYYEAIKLGYLTK